MKKIVITLILTTFGFVSSAQNPDSLMIRRIADEILINGKAYDNLRYLTKQIGARLAGSSGNGESRTMGI